LIAGQTDGGGGASVFIWDRVNDTIRLATHTSTSATKTSNGFSFNPVLSNDGSFLAFLSNTSDLVTGQTEDARRYDIFLWDRATGQTALISHAAGSPTTAANGASFGAVMSMSANYIAFYSAGTNLVSTQVDANQTYDLFLYERATGLNTLVSHTQGSTTSTDISADGNRVVYQSTAPDLVANDLNNAEDVFIWNPATNTNTLMSRSATSLISDSANAKSFGAHISADAKFVAFSSNASDLLAGQTSSGKGDVVLFDTTNSTLHLMSHTAGQSTTGGNDQSVLPLINNDGAFVAYDTQASNLVPDDNNGSGDVLIYDRTSDTKTAASNRAANLASITSNGHSGNARASANGRFVVFASEGTNLVGGQSDTNNATDIFVRDRQTNTTILVSHAAGTPSVSADGTSDSPAISNDGRWSTYASTATNLISNTTDLDGGYDIFLYDRVNDTTSLVSHSIIGTNFTASDVSETPGISGDGRFVVYASRANDLVTGQGDSNSDLDVFVYDRMNATTTLVSHDSAAATVTGTGYSFAPAISADGKFIGFYSAALDLVPNQSTPTSTVQHCFLYDRAANSNTLVDHQNGVAATTGDGDAGSTVNIDPPIFSADGNYIAFVSTSTNLVAGQNDTNSTLDIFLYDRAAGTNTLVSHAPSNAGTTADDISFNPSVSADGRFVSYRSNATNLVAAQNDTNTFQDVFLFDRTNGQNALVSHALGSVAAASNGSSGEAPRYGYQAVSPDGRFVAFWSSSTDLIQGDVDANGINGDVFLYDVATAENVLLTHSLDLASKTGNDGSGDSQHFGAPSWSADSHYLVFASRASNLIANDFNKREDVFLFSASTALQSVSAVSRKTHGAAGAFDINLPLTGTPGVECRTGGPSGDHQVVITFAGPVTFASAIVTSGAGSVASATANGNKITVNLTGVVNAQTIMVTLFNVNDGVNTGDVAVPMGVLVGDTSANGSVNSSDISQMKSESGNAVTGSNFREDVTVNGLINSSDISLVKSKSGTALP
jgi:WD40-like Beta Propeller Repeat